MIDHLAIWVRDLEKMKRFYITFFEVYCSDKYVNSARHFQSYFLSFPKGAGARIELMYDPVHDNTAGDYEKGAGLAHFAISLGSRKKVDEITFAIQKAGYTVIGEPRETGDGYYESVVLDPEENIVELTV